MLVILFLAAGVKGLAHHAGYYVCRTTLLARRNAADDFKVSSVCKFFLGAAGKDFPAETAGLPAAAGRLF
jgi:hypothetical protein